MNLVTHISVSKPGFSLGVNLDINAEGITGVFGPSGCGKTTWLRSLSGLERDSVGQIRFGGDAWQDTSCNKWVKPQQRDIGYVFQGPSLLPHLTARDNLLYAQKRRPSEHRFNLSLEDIAKKTKITHLLDRPASRLSGGEQQRVAIARAILAEPALLLMDEPLSALDSKTKQNLMALIRWVRREFNLPIIYVTHSLEELVMLSDNIILMADGHVVANGDRDSVLAQLYKDVIYGVSALSALTAEKGPYDSQDALQTFSVGQQQMLVPRSKPIVNSTTRLLVRASDIVLSHNNDMDGSVLNALKVQVANHHDYGNGQVLVELSLEGQSLFALISRRSAKELSITSHQQLYAYIKATAVDG